MFYLFFLRTSLFFVQDFQGQVKKLAEYLEVPLSDEKLTEITKECTIDSMKKNYQARSGFQGKHAAAFINKGNCIK